MNKMQFCDKGEPKSHSDSVYTLRNNASPGDVLLRTPFAKERFRESIY